MAARRIALEKPPSKSDEGRLMKHQLAVRKAVGGKMKAARLDAGMSQRQLAIKANVSSSYLSEAERGRRAFTIDFLARISYFLQMKLADFLPD